MAVNKVKTRTATIFSDENNIIHIIIHPNVRIDYEDALDNALVIKNLSKNKPCLKLLDMRANFSMEKKGQKFADSNEVKQQTIARAIIKGSMINSLLVNFFIKLNKPETPTRIFTDQNEAYAWLLSIKEERG